MSLMQKILQKIERDAIASSEMAVKNRQMVEDAERAQQLLMRHGATDAEPTWIDYGAIIFYDHSNDGSMHKAIASADLAVEPLGEHANTDGSHTERLRIKGTEVRIWITTRSEQLAEAA